MSDRTPDEPTEFDRRDRWQPAPRPEWVARINAEGELFDKKSIVPLDENSLLASARLSSASASLNSRCTRRAPARLIKSRAVPG